MLTKRDLLRGVAGLAASPLTSVVDRASLKSLSVSTGVAFLAEGLVYSHGGRTGLFAWDGTVPIVTHQADKQEGVYVAPNQTLDGAWVRIDRTPVRVTQFGAVGDGIADDTAPFQSAADYVMRQQPLGGLYGGKLIVPSGRYAVGPLRIYRSDGKFVSLSIEGESELTTIIQSSVGASEAITTSGLKHFGFKNLQIVKSGSQKQGTGIKLTNIPSGGTGTNAGVFENVMLAGFRRGINGGDSGRASSEITYINVEFQSCAIGLYIADYNALNHNLYNCSFSACDNGFYAAAGGVVNFFGGASAGCDIDFNIQTQQTYVISGFRSEGARRFLNVNPGVGMAWLHVAGCTVNGNSVFNAHQQVDATHDGVVAELRGPFRLVIKSSLIGGRILASSMGPHADITLVGSGIYRL